MKRCAAGVLCVSALDGTMSLPSGSSLPPSVHHLKYAGRFVPRRRHWTGLCALHPMANTPTGVISLKMQRPPAPIPGTASEDHHGPYPLTTLISDGTSTRADISSCASRLVEALLPMNTAGRSHVCLTLSNGPSPIVDSVGTASEPALSRLLYRLLLDP